ncbi:retrovirus-related Pol polyprotein from transposon TNT 1-94 [Trichonephila clavipes]|nr:retrovirus-related Pol polyprotein from transposon TNT 1-94 [Trichonephila clavipes]
MRVDSIPEAILNAYCGERSRLGFIPVTSRKDTVTRPFRGVIGPDFIFMDDNAWPHRTLVVQELLESEDINRMDWPACLSDLNPIEHLWDALERRFAARLHHPENTQ